MGGRNRRFGREQLAGENLKSHLPCRSKNCAISPKSFTHCLIFSSGHSHHSDAINIATCSSVNRRRIGFAGLPPTIVYGATSFTTTDRAAIIAPLLMVIPPGIIASDPIQTSLPTRVFGTESSNMESPRKFKAQPEFRFE